MRYLKHLILYSLICSLVLLSGCSASRRAFSKGEKFEADGKYEEAMYSYADAFHEDPETSEFRVRFLKARDKAADQHFKSGRDLFERGDYVAALAEFQSAYGLDPTQGRYKQQIEVTTRLKDAQLAYHEGIDFEKVNKFKDANRCFLRALDLDPGNKEYQDARARMAKMTKSKLEGAELSLKSSKPITLKFKDAKLKDVFNIVTQLSGINFVFDEAVKDSPITIYLENATFQQVLDLLTNMYKLSRKVLNESTVLVFPKTPDKHKQYEDMILRTFHMNYMEAKKAVNLIRTMIQVRKVYVNEDSNSVVVRDTADVVDVVEKILDANDVPDPEVILDVEVIEVSDNNKQRLGLLLSDYKVQMGLFSPSNKLMATTLSTAIPTSTTGSTPTIVEAGIDNLVRAFSIKGRNAFVTVPNATFNFGKELSKSEVLSNPKIRVKNKEKSKFTVGTRLPITTSNTTNATVSVNVQYVDVGVKVNAEPTIQLNNEIVIKLSLEVSQQVGAARDVGGGTSVVTIGTRNVETVLSLKDGETSVIGGLISHDKGDAKNKLLLLSDIPLLGHLFTDTQTTGNKTELMLAITPRLVRGVTVPGGNLMSFSSGKEDDPSLQKPMSSFEQEPVFETTPKGSEKPGVTPAAKPVVTPVTTPVIKPAPVTKPVAPAAPAVQAPVPAVPSPAALAAPTAKTPPQTPVAAAAKPPQAAPQTAPQVAAKPAAPPPPQRGILQINAPSSINLGQQFKVEVKVNDVKDLASAPFVLTYDPIFVEFVSAVEGDFLKKDGKPVAFTSKADAASGALTMTLARGSGIGGISGEGTLAVATFRTKNQGPASFGFRNINFTDVNRKPLTILPFSTAVDVR